jgi:DnaK suppressor protein
LYGEFKLLRKVRAALSRIDEGIYGICQQCEEDISPKRLNAVPWVPYCIRCQETADRNHEAGDETPRLVSVS